MRIIGEILINSKLVTGYFSIKFIKIAYFKV